MQQCFVHSAKDVVSEKVLLHIVASHVIAISRAKNRQSQFPHHPLLSSSLKVVQLGRKHAASRPTEKEIERALHMEMLIEFA